MPRPTQPLALGKVLKSVEVEGFILTETVRPPNLILPKHFHEHTNIAFVLEGVFMETVGSQPQECGPLSVILRPAGEVHANQYGRSAARYLILEVKPQRLAMIRQVSNILDRALHVREGWMSVLARRIYKEFQMMDSVSPLSIEALALDMLVQATRRSWTDGPAAAPRWLREAKDRIHEHFTRKLSLLSIAESVGVHPAHLAKMFRRYYHCTLGEYVRRLRLDYAAQTLRHPNRSLVEVALMAGFYDQSHFTHAFQRHTGMTPAEFRAAVQSNKSDTKRR